MKTQDLVLTLSLPLCLSACAVGSTSVLFATKSNFGLDVDTKPPTMELAISRRETAIAPTFAESHTLPLYADFGSRQGVMNKFFMGLSSTFAGGKAATKITTSENQKDPNPSCVDFTLPKDQEPHYWTLFKPEKPLPKQGRVRPFLFATDTVFGLKVVWNSPSDPVPDALKVGFNRKEFAWAPIHVNEGACPGKRPQPVGNAKAYHADMPSFFALIRTRNELTDFTNSRVRYVQIFATGKAAEGVAKILRDTVQEEVRALVTEAESMVTTGEQESSPKP